MAFCNDPIKFPYFTISRVYRDNAPMHYAFVGLNMKKTYKSLFDNMSNGNIPNKSDIQKLKNIFGNYSVNIWISFIKAKEPLIFINDRIWTDDTVFKIKTKLFIYLSNPKETFIIQQFQQIWMNINNKNEILGYMFEKENSDELIKYIPAIDSVPSIDEDFLTEEDERKSYINLVKEDNIILIDVINNLYLSSTKNKTYDPHIYLYVLNDEINWIKNNPILKNNIPVSTNRLWNGYIVKNWPTSNKVKESYDSTLKLYTSVKNQVTVVNQIVSFIREDNDTRKYDPTLKKCVISNMSLYTRPPKIEGSPPYRLNMIYNFLRTLISKEIPFIYYTQYGDKIPNVSIYKEGISEGLLTADNIQKWIFKKLPSGKYIPKGRGGTIQIKIYNYTTPDGEAKYETITLFQNRKNFYKSKI